MKKDMLYPLRMLHGRIHDHKQFLQKKNALYSHYRQLYRSKKKANRKTVYLILTPEHTNLGDHAIAFSETELLRQHGFDYIEITGAKLLELQKYSIQKHHLYFLRIPEKIFSEHLFRYSLFLEYV